MKFAFSLLELIFVIVVLGIIASFAIPKFIDTKDSALVSTIKRDIFLNKNLLIKLKHGNKKRTKNPPLDSPYFWNSIFLTYRERSF